MHAAGAKGTMAYAAAGGWASRVVWPAAPCWSRNAIAGSASELAQGRKSLYCLSRFCGRMQPYGCRLAASAQYAACFAYSRVLVGCVGDAAWQPPPRRPLQSFLARSVNVGTKTARIWTHDRASRLEANDHQHKQAASRVWLTLPCHVRHSVLRAHPVPNQMVMYTWGMCGVWVDDNDVAIASATGSGRLAGSRWRMLVYMRLYTYVA